MALAFDIANTGDVAPELRKRLDEFLSSSDSDAVRQRLRVAIQVTSRLRNSLTKTSLGSKVSSAPVSAEAFHQFLVDNKWQNVELANAKTTPTEPIRGVWASDAKYFVQWLNGLTEGQPSYRLLAKDEVTESAVQRALASSPDLDVWVTQNDEIELWTAADKNHHPHEVATETIVGDVANDIRAFIPDAYCTNLLIALALNKLLVIALGRAWADVNDIVAEFAKYESPYEFASPLDARREIEVADRSIFRVPRGARTIENVCRLADALGSAVKLAIESAFDGDLTGTLDLTGSSVLSVERRRDIRLAASEVHDVSSLAGLHDIRQRGDGAAARNLARDLDFACSLARRTTTNIEQAVAHGDTGPFTKGTITRDLLTTGKPVRDHLLREAFTELLARQIKLGEFTVDGIFDFGYSLIQDRGFRAGDDQPRSTFHLRLILIKLLLSLGGSKTRSEWFQSVAGFVSGTSSRLFAQADLSDIDEPGSIVNLVGNATDLVPLDSMPKKVLDARADLGDLPAGSNISDLLQQFESHAIPTFLRQIEIDAEAATTLRLAAICLALSGGRNYVEIARAITLMERRSTGVESLSETIILATG